MQSKILSNRILLVMTLFACLLLAGFFLYYILQNDTEIDSIPIKVNVAELLKKEKENLPSVSQDSTLPMRLKIPRINVDAVVEYVGITPEGAMDVPKGPAEVAWYELGSRPGEIGSAVIAGHSGWKNNRRAVFDNLNKLKKGDKIYVEDEKGGLITFVVREKRLYDPNADATDVFSSSDGKAHLNLITCEGVWDEVTKSRSKRLVVFTDREIE